ncbi:2,4-dienoyl-CoA reductase-like NADH-dependent reductase (Old Yellow Enzyme family) [Luteococcus japonicus]|uniref:2,4-dienoyl-CoA reductase-like NADH-dependent reductase (Old Yellow Enzyme family) n=1 Tax=Luteococcus japonicus TaxID=33984 RepID=A0A3N1ZV88_9ACTN|nr:NADH:flavin oxidoreductase/NADH oxidase [Luteococcus japonicus]ROR54761.1 2,4-dienoyl-CoA reductase-like NADH-dependent reductase (Old Yellow Enzyme family) [Luteococcus japonicus]
MSTPALFRPIQLGSLTVRNRAWVSPMCQYSVEQRDGVVNDWHLVHYGSLAAGGFGLVVVEATGVSPEARISPWDAGLWNDQQATAWRRVTDFAHAQGAAIGVQLAHAGRKASTNRWWPGEEARNIPADEGGWTPVGPTTERGAGEEFTSEVQALDEAGIQEVIDDFAAAAVRAKEAGFDLVEVHAAHGYLLHQFYSPLSNTRTDQWGGSWENRTRLLLAVVDAIRQVWTGALAVRISATDWTDGDWTDGDWTDGGWDGEDSAQLAIELREHGVDLVDVSTGGLVMARIPVGPGYQVPYAEQVRSESGVVTSAVGMITEPEQAEQIIAEGRADAVMLARQALREPGWPLRAAHELGLPADQAPWPPARWRGVWR